MDRGSSPTNHITAAANAHEGIRQFDPLAFNAAPIQQPPANGRHYGNGLPSSSISGYHAGSDVDGHAGSSLNGTPGARLGGRQPEHRNADDTAMDTDPTPRSKGRPRNLQNVEEIPPVTDETGERVREAFREFLQR